MWNRKREKMPSLLLMASTAKHRNDFGVNKAPASRDGHPHDGRRGGRGHFTLTPQSLWWGVNLGNMIEVTRKVRKGWDEARQRKFLVKKLKWGKDPPPKEVWDEMRKFFAVLLGRGEVRNLCSPLYPVSLNHAVCRLAKAERLGTAVVWFLVA